MNYFQLNEKQRIQKPAIAQSRSIFCNDIIKNEERHLDI